MFYKMSIRKILISLCALFAMTLIYLIPKEEKFTQELNYTKENLVFNDIYLLDGYNYVSLTKVPVSGKDVVEKAKELLSILTLEGTFNEFVPNGFRATIPSDTRVLNVDYVDNILKVNFSKEFLDIKEENEEDLISSIVYTLTSLEDVKGVILYVDGEILTCLPSGRFLPALLDRSYGVNRIYDIENYKNVKSVNIYYTAKNKDDYYYVPVTKYVNDDREKISVIIEELTSMSTYNTNLLSFLNSNTKLLKTSNEDDILTLTFNNYIFDDIENSKILEEVIHTISLSVKDNYDVKDVVFVVNNEQIYKSVLKTVD